ncbi:NUDIX domain-containing protein [Terasakiispira papahanaumokuakeensis]|uniref:NUDIX domain-containing protein n=1 Tax=Terasakiispira papahanaumokuakeensis TaxID=197479 RepID=UPI0009FD8941|nr:NUDIX domain-containing protein [Terasakiispira papahanaumokuakeensis]
MTPSDALAKPHQDDWTLTSQQCVYQGFFSLDKLILNHRRFDGSWQTGVTRECMRRGMAVGVLAYDPWQDSVVLVEQFRVGALNHRQGPWLTELIAGLVESGETVTDVAIREAQEEAGLSLLDLSPIYTYFSSPGGSDETVSLWCAIVDSRGVGGLHGLAEEHEDIQVKVMSRTDALALMGQGVVDNAMALIGLQWLALNAQKLQTRWATQPVGQLSPLSDGDISD